MRRLVLLLLPCLLWASPGEPAPLTATEKAEIAEVATALDRLTTAWLYLGHSTSSTTSASRAALKAVWGAQITAYRNLWRGYALLLYVNPAAPGDTSTYASYEALARSAWLSEALSSLSTAATNMGTVRSAITTAEAVGGQAGAYYTNLDAMDNEVAAAETALSGFDTGGGYLNPRDTLWFPQIVSPHGDWIRSTRLLFAAGNRMLDTLDSFRQVYDAAGQGETELPTSTNESFLRINSAASLILPKFTRVLRSFANIPGLSHCQFSPHHFMARIVETLTRTTSESQSMTTPHKGGEFLGAPYAFHMAAVFNTNFLEHLRLPLADSRPNTWVKFNEGLGHYFESWQAQDGAVWDILSFPQGVTLSSLRVQAGRSNVDNVPPLCPDAAAPTVALNYPANGQTVGGRLTIRASCKDDIGTLGEQGTLCKQMTILVDDVVVATVVALPYEYQWDTTLETNGSHTIKATGYDAAGNTATTSTVTVTVGN